MTLLRDDWRQPTAASIRHGFGHGLVKAAQADQRVMALSANLMSSVGLAEFAEVIGPPRYVEVGVAEQNLVTVAAGLAAMGAVPFAASYAAFSPGRNWEQIRTTICLNRQPVKLVGSHAGLNVGPDGATHQMLEDIALMRVLPDMVVLAPGDAYEAEQLVQAMVDDPRPNYLRMPRQKTPLFLQHQVTIGQAYTLRPGTDVTLLGTGVMTYQLLQAAEQVAVHAGIDAEVIHVPTIKPLDTAAIIASATKCGVVITAEEGQMAGGFGSAVAELLTQQHQSVPVVRIGVDDQFGESGTMAQLWHKHHLDSQSIAEVIQKVLQ